MNQHVVYHMVVQYVYQSWQMKEQLLGIKISFYLYTICKMLYLYSTLFNDNTLDLYACLIQLKQTLKIEEHICIKNNNEDKFLRYHFIYENL